VAVAGSSVAFELAACREVAQLARIAAAQITSTPPPDLDLDPACLSVGRLRR
jgi:hypothetical protein